MPECQTKPALADGQRPFDQIMRRYAGMVFRVCYGVTRNVHDAEDATQAAFLALHQQMQAGNGIEHVGAWLQQVAQHAALDLQRGKRRRVAREEIHHSLSQNHDNGTPPGPEWDESRLAVAEELDQLPPAYRMPLILHYFGGLSHTEMAKQMGCQAGTLRVRLFRARRMLGERLARRGFAVSDQTLAISLEWVIHRAVTESIQASIRHGTTGWGFGGHAAQAWRDALSLKAKAAVCVGLVTASAMSVAIAQAFGSVATALPRKIEEKIGQAVKAITLPAINSALPDIQASATHPATALPIPSLPKLQWTPEVPLPPTPALAFNPPMPAITQSPNESPLELPRLQPAENQSQQNSFDRWYTTNFASNPAPSPRFEFTAPPAGLPVLSQIYFGSNGRIMLPGGSPLASSGHSNAPMAATSVSNEVPIAGNSPMAAATTPSAASSAPTAKATSPAPTVATSAPPPTPPPVAAPQLAAASPEEPAPAIFMIADNQTHTDVVPGTLVANDAGMSSIATPFLFSNSIIGTIAGTDIEGDGIPLTGLEPDSVPLPENKKKDKSDDLDLNSATPNAETGIVPEPIGMAPLALGALLLRRRRRRNSKDASR